MWNTRWRLTFLNLLFALCLFYLLSPLLSIFSCLVAVDWAALLPRRVFSSIMARWVDCPYCDSEPRELFVLWFCAISLSGCTFLKCVKFKMKRHLKSRGTHFSPQRSLELVSTGTQSLVPPPTFFSPVSSRTNSKSLFYDINMPTFQSHTNSQVMLSSFLFCASVPATWHKHLLGLEDELIRFWWSKVSVTSQNTFLAIS